MAGVQQELAGRLAAVERREASVVSREGFCARLEAELAARATLLEMHGAAAAAQAAGRPLPGDAAAQVGAAMQMLQTLTAHGGMPSEQQQAHHAEQQHLQQQQHEQAAAAQQAAAQQAAAFEHQQQQRQRGADGQQPAHWHSDANSPADDSPNGGAADSHLAGSTFACGDSAPLRMLGRELRAAGVLGGPPAACQRQGAAGGGGKGQPAFSQHSHPSTMSHATAIGANDRYGRSPLSSSRDCLKAEFHHACSMLLQI